jgi:hypothetical protein
VPGLAYQRAVAAVGLAAALHALGRHDAALEHAQRGLWLTERGGFRLLHGRAETTLAGIRLSLGDRAGPAPAGRIGGEPGAARRQWRMIVGGLYVTPGAVLPVGP